MLQDHGMELDGFNAEVIDFCSSSRGPPIQNGLHQPSGALLIQHRIISLRPVGQSSWLIDHANSHETTLLGFAFEGDHLGAQRRRNRRHPQQRSAPQPPEELPFHLLARGASSLISLRIRSQSSRCTTPASDCDSPRGISLPRG